MFDWLGNAGASDVAARWSPSLTDAAIKGLLVLLAAGIATTVMRRASAAARHLVWGVAAAGLVALPLLSATLPQWRVLPRWLDWPGGTGRWTSVRTEEPGREGAAVEPTVASSADREGAQRRPAPSVSVSLDDRSLADAARSHEKRSLDMLAPLGALTAAHPIPSSAGAGAAATAEDRPSSAALTASGPGESQAAAADAPLRSIAGWVLLTWLTGAVVVMLQTGLGRLRLRRLGRVASPMSDGQWDRLLAGLADEVGWRRRVVLLRGGPRTMPMAWGLLRPTLLLPAEAEAWSADRRRVVLLHELAHLKRVDALWLMIARTACALHWFNPLVWVATRRMVSESERACDDLVLRVGSPAPDYAEHLLQVASRACTGGPCGAIAMARRSQMEGRLLAILDASRSRRPMTTVATLAALAAGICVLIPLASVRPAAMAAGEPQPRLAEADVSSAGSVPDKDAQDAVVLSHVDDTAEGKRSLAGSGHAVAFERPDGIRFVERVEVFASRYGHARPPDEDFHLYVLNEKRQVLADVPVSYGTIKRGQMQWYSLRTPSIEVPKSFFVALAFNPHRTKGIFLGYDEGVKESHSLTGLPDEEFQPVVKPHDWMVRVHLSKEPTRLKGVRRLADWKPPKRVDGLDGTVEVKYDTGKSQGQQSYSGAGPAVRFDLSTVLRKGTSQKDVTLAGVRVYAGRYGSGYDTKRAQVTLSVLDAKGKCVRECSFPYARFRYKAGWVDLVLPKPLPLDALGSDRRTLTVLLDPGATRTKGIFFHYNKDPKRSHSLSGSLKRGLKPLPEREWMIRAHFRTPGKAGNKGLPSASPAKAATPDDERAAASTSRTLPWCVTGKVTDGSGRPMPGVDVSVSTGRGSLMPSGSMRSDESGDFTLRFRGHGTRVDDATGNVVAPVQAATVGARMSGYYEKDLCRQGGLVMADRQLDPNRRHWRGPVVLPNKPYRVDFVMLPAARIKGRLVDADGWPITRQMLIVGGEALYPSASVLANVHTDPEGRFVVENVPCKSYWFEIRQRPGKPDVRSRPLRIIAPASYDIVLTCDEGKSGGPGLEHRVPSGTPIAGRGPLPTARNENRPNSFEGPVTFGADTLLYLAAGTSERERAIECHLIRFEKKDDGLWATLEGRWSSVMTGTWEATVTLLDEAGDTLAMARDTCRTVTVIEGGMAHWQEHQWRFGLGLLREQSRAARFTVHFKLRALGALLRGRSGSAPIVRSVS